MALLTYAVDLHKVKQATTQDPTLANKLTELDELLDKLLV